MLAAPNLRQGLSGAANCAKVYLQTVYEEMKEFAEKTWR